RALYGRRLQQPFGGQQALSARLLDHLLVHPKWNWSGRDVSDLWITGAAIADGFAVWEAWLGPHAVRSRTRTGDLPSMLAETLGADRLRVRARPSLRRPLPRAPAALAGAALPRPHRRLRPGDTHGDGGAHRAGAGRGGPRLRATEALSRGTLALTMPPARKTRLPVRKEPGAPAPTRTTAGPRGDLPPAADLRRTVVIEAIAPNVDGGRYPVKREVGAVFEVSADIFKE